MTVTARIHEQLKKRLAGMGMNVSELIRRALKQKAEKADRERLRKLADEAGRILQEIPSEELVKTILESREAR